MAETRALFGNIVQYYHQAVSAGSVWGPNALTQILPNFNRCDDESMTTDAICAEVRNDRLRVELKQAMQSAQDIVESDPQRALSVVQEASERLRGSCTSRKIDVHISDALQRIWETYQRAEAGEVVSCFPWPWQPIQDATLGVRNTDYIIFYARPKSMKSWVLCFMIATIIRWNPLFKILIYTKEMDADEMFERIACVLAFIEYENFTRSKLTPDEKARLYQVVLALNHLRDQQTVVCLSAQNVQPGQDTVTWLAAKMSTYQPQAVFVDGMYLMSDHLGARRPHERITNVSREIRQLILRTKIPIIATVQANRQAAQNEEANTEEVAFSDSLGQDATMLIRIVNEWKKGENTLALVMGGASRRHKLPGFRIYGMPAVNFGFFGELTEKEAQAALQNDSKGGANKAAKPTTHNAGASAGTNGAPPKEGTRRLKPVDAVGTALNSAGFGPGAHA